MISWISVDEEMPATALPVLLAFVDSDGTDTISIGWNESMPDEEPQFFVPEFRGWVEPIYWAKLPDFPVSARE